ncbi:hypothetical protein SDC9_147620 [bioreactor metagenome]|uniref:Uncharacterized protein n=1 Tax=bioreactor metagenome TaxID=1076179 RepID=A0A645EEE7_9ZZZZ
MRKGSPFVIIITTKPAGLLRMLHNSGEGTETDIVNGLPYIRLNRGQQKVYICNGRINTVGIDVQFIQIPA